MNILIIGGGVAAFEAAVAAAASENCKVTLCSGEAVPPYRRPALSRMVAEELSETAFYFKQISFYQERNIDLRLGKNAVSIDREKQLVTFADGEVLPYDKLILATGSSAFIPPLPGAKEYACALRDYNDLQYFRSQLAAGVDQAVVIGGGVLGLELVDSLLAKGCKVTLVESGSSVLARNLDSETGAKVTEQLRKLPGLTIKTNAKVCEVTKDSVILEDETLPSALTVFSTGVRSCSALAADAGLEVSPAGIVVNERMESSDKNIFSCGDAAAPPAGGFKLLSAAKAMGQTAGTNAAGGDAVYTPESCPVRMMALGLKIFSAGKLEDAACEVTDDGNGNCQRLVRDAQGNLTGVILTGDLKAAVKLQKELTC